MCRLTLSSFLALSLVPTILIPQMCFVPSSPSMPMIGKFNQVKIWLKTVTFWVCFVLMKKPGDASMDGAALWRSISRLSSTFAFSFKDYWWYCWLIPGFNLNGSLLAPPCDLFHYRRNFDGDVRNKEENTRKMRNWWNGFYFYKETIKRNGLSI